MSTCPDNVLGWRSFSHLKVMNNSDRNPDIRRQGGPLS